MAVRGKVYNVTRYLDYHPGGAAELMKGAGKDATSLFDEAHAYVNIDQLLAKCFVGPLRNTVTLNLKDSWSNMDLRPSSSLASVLKFPSVLSASSEGLNKFDKFETPAQSQNIEVIPRFDWIQKTSELSIYYYTKSLCNPGVSIERMNEKECEIKILIANTSNSYKFSFLKSLRWPCLLQINQETGELTFNYSWQKSIDYLRCRKNWDCIRENSSRALVELRSLRENSDQRRYCLQWLLRGV